MTNLIESHGNVVSLKDYRSFRNLTGHQPVSNECNENDGTGRLKAVTDGCLLAVLNIIIWAPFIWALASLTVAP
jgi:hypothetical protein